MSSWIVRVLLLAVVNFLAGKLALILAIPPGYATAMWPPSGIALGAVLLWGYRMLPGVLIGSFLVNVDIGDENVIVSVLVALCIGLASTLQAATGAFLIRRFVGFPNPLVRQRDVCAFFALGGPIACLSAATLAVVSLWGAGFIPTSSIPFSWWTWWVGDSIGVLIFSPLILVLFGAPREVWARRKSTVAFPLLVAVVGVTFLFVYASSREHQRQQLEFNERCTRIADELTDQLHGYQEVMWSVGRFFNSSEQVTRNEFRRFTEPTMQRLRGMQGIGWNPKVPFQARASFEARVREEGFPHFRVTERDASGQLIPVQPRDQYFPALYVVPFDGNLESLGYDVASEPIRAEAMERALIRNEAGIAEKDLVRIFERFERAAIPGQQRGLGLGLFIVRQIVEAHGGTVHAESEQGRGATFIVEMPLSAEMSKQ